MGVYLCLGQSVHEVKNIQTALICSNFTSYREIHEYLSIHNKIFLFLGKGVHKIKKKAEQFACEEAIRIVQLFDGENDEGKNTEPLTP
jgi:hypothetical protein